MKLLRFAQNLLLRILAALQRTTANNKAALHVVRFGLLLSTYTNTVRLHSAIGFVTPADMLAGRQKEIHAARDRKLEEARRQRQLRRQVA